MPPKKATTIEDLVTALSDKLDALTEQQQKCFDDMEVLLKAVQEENSALKSENSSLSEKVEQVQAENISLKDKINKLEQHSRHNNVRIFAIAVDGDDRNGDLLIDKLYNKAFLPILQGALSKGRLNEIPSRNRLIQSAHVLPGKEGKPKPIICRFTNSHLRSVLLQCKREFAPRLPGSSASTGPGPSRPAPMRYPMYEDVSPETYRFLQQLSANISIGAAWVAGGTIRYKLSNSDTVHRLGSIYDPIEKILSV